MATQYAELLGAQRAYYKTGATRSVEARKQALNSLRRMVEENIEAIGKAYERDLARGKQVALFECNTMCDRINYQLEHLEEWMRATELPVVCPLSKEAGDTLLLVKEPLGVVLNIAPWNGPVTSLGGNMYPLAAGNTVIFKPSELAPCCATLWEDLAPKYFDRNEFAVVTGGVAETTELLKERFDHIFYTGSSAVARIVMAAAARHLTPVTLELGGKNPTFVDDTADIDQAAESLIRAKCYGAGQVCICPDYVLVTPKVKSELIGVLKTKLQAEGDLTKREFFGRIIHERAFDRLEDLLRQSKGTVVGRSGTPDRNSLHFPVTVVEVAEGDALLEDELFGPILPILEVRGLDEAIAHIHNGEKPLAAYAFTKNDQVARRFVSEVSAGGVTVNDVMMHTSTAVAPFGGVGGSGMGRIMGKYGFEAFTHEKAVALRKGTAI